MNAPSLAKAEKSAAERRADRIEVLLSNCELTTARIMSILHIGRNCACQAMHILREQRRIYIVRYEPPPAVHGQWIAIYKAGNLADAPRPRKTSHEKYMRDYEYQKRYREMHREENRLYQRAYQQMVRAQLKEEKQRAQLAALTAQPAANLNHLQKEAA